MSGFGAALGGAGLSTLGGVLGSQSANRAGRKNRDFLNTRYDAGSTRNWNALYGAGGGGRAGLDAFSTGASGPPTASAGSILGRQQGIADLYGQRAGGIRSEFDSGMAGLNNLYGQSEGLAAEYGRGGEALIDQETQRGLQGANRLAGARLAGAGFGNSTAIGNQVSQNASDFARSASEQKLGLRGQALQMRLGVRGQQAAAQNQNLGRRADLATSTLGNEMGYQQVPIQTEYGALNSNVMNPWLGRDASSFYPGYSAAGTALTNAGNSLGTYGGYQMMYGQQGGPQGGGGGGQMQPNDLSYSQYVPGYMNRPH